MIILINKTSRKKEKHETNGHTFVLRGTTFFRFYTRTNERIRGTERDREEGRSGQTRKKIK